jgi:hypothetical protein
VQARPVGSLQETLCVPDNKQIKVTVQLLKSRGMERCT